MIKKLKLNVLIIICFFSCQQMPPAQQKKGINKSWTSYFQSIDVSKKENLDFRLSAYLKKEDLKKNGTPGLWVRIDKKDKSKGFFINTFFDKSYIVSNKWEQFVVKGKIDENAEELYFGAYCRGLGDFYFDNFKLEIKSKDGKWEIQEINNSSFEEERLNDAWNEGIRKSKSSKVKNFEIRYSSKKPFKGSQSLHIKGSNFTQINNLDFEIIENEKPKGWGFEKTENYTIELDDEIKFNGKYSLLIECKKINDSIYTSSPFQPISHRIPIHFPVKKVKLTCYYKTEGIINHGANIWLSVYPRTGFISSQFREPLKNNTNWTKYELTVNIDPQFQKHVEGIYFGPFLKNKGKIWVDNFSITINDKPLSDYDLKFFNEKKDEEKKDWFFYYKSSLELINEDHDKALNLVNEGIRLLNPNKPSLEIITLYKLKSSIYILKDEPSDLKALENLNLALELSKSLENPSPKLAILSQISEYYNKSGNKLRSIEIQKELINELTKIDQNQTIYNIASNLSITSSYDYMVKTYIDLKNPVFARKYNALMYENLHKEKDFNTKYWLREYKINNAEIHFLNNEYSLAKEKFMNAFEYNILDYTEPYREAQKAFCFGKIAYMEKDYDKSIDILEKGIKSYKKYPEKEDEYYLYLAKSYKNNNSPTKSSYYFEKHIEISSIKEKRGDTISTNLYNVEKKLTEKTQEQLENKNQKISLYIKYGVVFLIILFMVFGMLFFQIRKRNKTNFDKILMELESKNSTNETKKETFVTSHKLKEETVSAILTGLQQLEEKLYFLNADCNTHNVAKKLKTNTTYLSKVISTNYQINFNTYINNLRISYALSRLKNNSQFRAYSIQSISEELGYKSPDSFTKYFKKRTGLLPSYFIKKLNEKYA